MNLKNNFNNVTIFKFIQKDRIPRIYKRLQINQINTTKSLLLRDLHPPYIIKFRSVISMTIRPDTKKPTLRTARSALILCA